MTFNAPPSGDTLKVSFDIFVQLSSQVGSSGTVSVVDHGRRIAPVDFHTFLLP
jgi:hypothetical protein